MNQFITVALTCLGIFIYFLAGRLIIDIFEYLYPNAESEDKVGIISSSKFYVYVAWPIFGAGYCVWVTFYWIPKFLSLKIINKISSWKTKPKSTSTNPYR